MTERDYNPGAIEDARQAAMRAENIPKIVDALHDARSALSRAPSSLRHAARFAQDISIMIDAMNGQRGDAN